VKVDGGRRPAARPGLSRRALARFVATVCTALLAWPSLAERPAAAGPVPGRAAIASAHPLATEAGFEILARGGNAFDAAVAVSAALAVVEPNGSGPGGGGFYLLHRASDGRQVVVDAREVAPAAATPGMFLDANGNPVEGLSTRHALGAAIPGAPAGWQHLADAYGRLPLATSLAPAIRLAREGFVLTGRMSEDLGRALRDEGLLDDGQREFARIYLVDGQPPPAGHRLRLPELAATLEVLARGSADALYRGPFAQRLVRGVVRLGGLWTLDDLAGYRIVEREPVVATYRGLRVLSTPPPSSGGAWLANVLNVLSGYELDALDSTTRKHVMLEAMRRAHRDRAQYLGDPAFTDVPLRLLTSPDYAAGLRASIRADRATPSDALPGYVDAGNPGVHTTHFSVLDAEGNRVAGTITLNGWFGSGIVVPGTGILLNNQMDDFAVKAGVPNMYGLVGAAANAIAPGKRPLSSMSPTFVEGARGVAILGTPGGSYIPSMVLLGILAWQSGADAAAIASAPRLHHQYRPDAVFAEAGALTPGERAGLEERGHSLRPWPGTIGNLQVVTWDVATGRVDAASDPRWGGAAAVRPDRDASATP
jgi:gamma-glutamyltranspeptidase/glutathione hydrolase